MNPYSAVLTGTRLREKQNATSDDTGFLAVLLLAEGLDSNNFSGVDFYTEVEARLAGFGLPPHFISQLATQHFAGPKSKLQRGL